MCLFCLRVRVWTTWRTLYNFFRLHEDLHEHPISSKNAVNMTCWPDLICYLRCALPEVNLLHQDNCLFCLCTFVLTTWRTFEFLLLHEDVSDHPSRNTMKVTSWTRSPDMNLFRHMKTPVSIQLQWSSLANLIRSLHVNTECNKPFLLCYTFMSCPILAAHIHVCCFWWNDMTLHHDRYLNLTFNAS